MKDVIGVKRIAQEYVNELASLEDNRLYVAHKETAALDKVRKAYLTVRDERLRHENEQWLERMQEQLQADVNRLRAIQEEAQATIAGEDGRGHCVIDMETRLAKLASLEKVFEEWGVVPLRNGEHVKFEGKEFSFTLELRPEAIPSAV